jgi:hypothetical protein
MKIRTMRAHDEQDMGLAGRVRTGFSEKFKHPAARLSSDLRDH